MRTNTNEILKGRGRGKIKIKVSELGIVKQFEGIFGSLRQMSYNHSDKNDWKMACKKSF